MNYIRITFEKLDLNEVNDLVVNQSCGAISYFVGTTRDNFDGKTVVHLEYEAYEGMARKVMSHICDEMRFRWEDIKHIAIFHRLGTVPVKESSVIIAVSSPHRKTSLEAVQFAIDELKKSVPIWKKEQYKDGQGSSEWKENAECTWSNSNKI